MVLREDSPTIRARLSELQADDPQGSGLGLPEVGSYGWLSKLWSLFGSLL